jgi:hypothetical protein
MLPSQPEQPDIRPESDSDEKDQQELARRVAERVWELWREDLRHSQERLGKRDRD